MRAFLQEKTPTGQPWSTIYYDDNGAQTYSRSTTQYDDRGLPLHTVLIRTRLRNVTLGVQTRNVAGLVTRPAVENTYQADAAVAARGMSDGVPWRTVLRVVRAVSSVASFVPGPVGVAARRVRAATGLIDAATSPPPANMEEADRISPLGTGGGGVPGGRPPERPPGSGNRAADGFPTRAGHNGVAGPAREQSSKPYDGGSRTTITYRDGSRKDVTVERVKEYAPAPGGNVIKVTFPRPERQPGKAARNEIQHQQSWRR